MLAVTSSSRWLRHMPSTRLFMSAAFGCKEHWESRLKAPIFQSVEMNKFYFDIERKFQREGRGSPIDMDIFSNAILKPNRADKPLRAEAVRDRYDQLEDLLKRFRRTPQTNMALDSTSHAVIRSYVDTGHEVSLMRILSSREEFGIFADDYALVYMLDSFLKGGNLRDAAKVAVQCMLQEEFSVEIAGQMSLLAAYNFALSLPSVGDGDWNPKLPTDPAEASPPEDDAEETKVRVWFVDNNYFDDHFDLRDRNHLVGKTLATFAEHGLKDLTESSRIEDVRFSLKLLGLCLWQKWEKVAELCRASESQRAAKECLELVRQHALNLSDGEEKDKEGKSKAAGLVGELKPLDAFDLAEYLKAEVLKSVETFEETFIRRQIEVYEKWVEGRESELNNQHDMYLRETRLAKLQQAKKDLADREERLFFFDNYEKMEKMKREKFVNWRKKWPRKTGVRMPPKEEIKDDYMPPEVRRQQKDF